MSSQELRGLLSRDPYVPVRIKLSNGDSFHLRDPSVVVVMKSSVFFALPDDGFKNISLIHIVNAELLQAAKAKHAPQ